MAVAMKCWGRAKQTCNLNWKNDKPYMWKYYLYTPCIYIYIPAIHIYIYTLGPYPVPFIDTKA